jgi:SAM-dependent methyltransferase
MEQDSKRSDTPPAEFDFEAVFEVDDYLYFYSEVLDDQRTEEEVSALASLLELDAPKKILDLACGFGRHTNRLAGLGHTMTGVDLTPGFLEIARKDAIQRKVAVNYQQGDMRSITFENEFDRVMLLFTAFGYFSDEENLKVLIHAGKTLKPSGLLIFDTPNRDILIKELRPYFVMEKEGNLMIDRTSFDSMQGRLYNKRIVIRNGIRKDKPFFTRLYTAQEIMALIIQAGLELEHIYGGWDGSEFSSASHRMVVIARKP